MISKILTAFALGLNTPEEMLAELPQPPPELEVKVPGIAEAMQKAMGNLLPGTLRQARREHREIAAELVEQMKIT